MNIKAQWQNLNQREQCLVTLMIIAVVACLWWYLLVSPLLKANRDLQITRNQQQRLLPWMAETVAILERLPQADPQTQQDPTRLINASLQRPEMRAFPANIQQHGTSISVRFATIPFPVAMSWLESLPSLHVSQLTAQRTSQAPNVTLQVQFH